MQTKKKKIKETRILESCVSRFKLVADHRQFLGNFSFELMCFIRHFTTPRSIEGFTVADAILVVGQNRVGKIVILMLDNLRKVDIVQFL